MKATRPFSAFLFFLFALVQVQGFGKISARIEYASFPAEKGGGRLFLMFGIDGKSLKYKKLKDQTYQASATFAISVNDSLHNFFAEKLEFVSPEVAASSQFRQEFVTTKTIELPSGRFKLEILAYDANATDTAKGRISIPIEMKDASKALVASELCLLSGSSFNHQVPLFDQDARSFRLSDFYASTDSVISFYGEMNGMSHKLAQGQTFISRYRILDPATRRSQDAFGKIRKMKYRTGLAFKSDLIISTLPSGNYLLVWDIIDTTGKILVKTEKAFQKSNPNIQKTDDLLFTKEPSSVEQQVEKMTTEECRLMVASLTPVAKASEQPTIAYLRKKGTDAELRNYLKSYWPKHKPTDPGRAMAEFEQLLAEATKQYATKAMPAYQTDRGRVMLQYGKPNLIENEYTDRFRKAMENLNTIPYEVWYYYKLEGDVKQSDVIFSFVQENRGNYNYRLIHSTALGEVRNREWRKSVENNGTTNFDHMDANDRYDSQDSKKFR